jgi:hypothetical protein
MIAASGLPIPTSSYSRTYPADNARRLAAPRTPQASSIVADRLHSAWRRAVFAPADHAEAAAASPPRDGAQLASAAEAHILAW